MTNIEIKDKTEEYFTSEHIQNTFNALKCHERASILKDIVNSMQMYSKVNSFECMALKMGFRRCDDGSMGWVENKNNKNGKK